MPWGPGGLHTLAQTGWLKATENCLLTALELEGPKSRGQQAWFLLQVSGLSVPCLSPSPWCSLAGRSITINSASVISRNFPLCLSESQKKVSLTLITSTRPYFRIRWIPGNPGLALQQFLLDNTIQPIAVCKTMRFVVTFKFTDGFDMFSLLISKMLVLSHHSLLDDFKEVIMTQKCFIFSPRTIHTYCSIWDTIA